jgi:type II secretory pathway component GspD/PulD (secretin)
MLSKKETLKIKSRVPFFGDIPFLGYLLGTESSQVKTTQLVVVVSCKEEDYNASSRALDSDFISGVKETLKSSKEKPELGYDKGW